MALASEAALYPVVRATFEHDFAIGEPGLPLALQQEHASHFHANLATDVLTLEWWDSTSERTQPGYLVREWRCPSTQAVAVALASRYPGDKFGNILWRALLTAQHPLDAFLLPACATAAGASAAQSDLYIRELSLAILECAPPSERITVLMQQHILPSSDRLLAILRNKSPNSLSEDEQAALAWIVLTSAPPPNATEREALCGLASSWKGSSQACEAVQLLMQATVGECDCNRLVQLLHRSNGNPVPFVDSVVLDVLRASGEAGTDCLTRNIQELVR